MLPAGKRFVKERLQKPWSDLYWKVYGRTIRNPDIGGNPSSVLFICLGNLCRSPFAERIARRIFFEAKMCEVEVISAGIEVSAPFPSPDFAISAGRQFGVDLEDHRSAGITEEMVLRSDMILVMETSQLLSLRGRFPGKREAIFLLPLFDEHRFTSRVDYHRYNISDPYGRDLEYFVACFERITRCVQGLAVAVAGRDVLAKR